MRKTRVLKQLLFAQFLRGINSFLAQRECLSKLLGELESRWGKETVSAALGNASIKKLRSRKLRRPTSPQPRKNPQVKTKGKKIGLKEAANLMVTSILSLGKAGEHFTSSAVAADVRSKGYDVSNSWASFALSKMIRGIMAARTDRKPFPYKIIGSVAIKENAWGRTKTPKRKKKA